MNQTFDGAPDLEIGWIGDTDFCVRLVGTVAACQAADEQWQSITTFGDLRELGHEHLAESLIDEDVLAEADVDPDLLHTDPAALPDGLPVDGQLAWDLAMDQELLAAPHQAPGAYGDLLLLPAEVQQLADVGGASPINSEGFVTFPAAVHDRVVAVLREAGHSVTDAGSIYS